MNIFDSFVTWLENLFKPLIKLYHEDSTTFFVGAILVILVLLIIVIWIARRAESDDKPSKKIKYEDIDWSMDGDRAKAEIPQKTETAVRAESAVAAKEEPAGKSYGIGEVDVDKNTFGHEGLPPEITEALMKSVRPRAEEFSVPMWMTKRTLSLDDIDLVDAQEWVEEQLKAEEVKAHDRQVEKATVERIAEILEKIDLCDKAKEDYKKRAAQLSETDDTVEKEKIDLDEIAPLEPEKGSVAEPKTEEAIQPEPEAVPDKQAERADLETGTLAKILKEAEEIKAENDSGEGEPDAVGSGWGVAETLARLEAMQAENDSLLKEIEEDGEYFEDKVKVSNFDDFEPQTDNFEKPIISSLEEELMDSEVPHSGVIEPEVPTERRRVRRFGLGNRDTNRSGRKFTEEELMEQIRD